MGDKRSGHRLNMALLEYFAVDKTSYHYSQATY